MLTFGMTQPPKRRHGDLSDLRLVEHDVVRPLDRALKWCGARAMSARNVAWIWGVLLTLIWLMRSFLFPGGGPDEAEQLVSSQSVEWGYGARNPPLFTWMVTAAQQLFGVTIASVVFVKCTLLGAAYYFLFKSAQHVLTDERSAALAALSPLAIYYAVWDTSFRYTHSLTLVFSICASFYFLLRLETQRTHAAYIWLGLAIGSGFLSKYNYILFLAAITAAACTESSFRSALRDVRIALTLSAATLLAAPHYYWLWSQRDNLTKHIAGRFTTETADGGTFVGIFGLIDAGTAVVNFLLPLLVIYILLFPRAFTREGSRKTASARYRRILERSYLIVFAITAASIVVFDVTRVSNHYMFLLILFPIYFLARVQAAHASERALNQLATALLALAVIVPAGVAVKYAVDPYRHSKSYFNMPYEAFARQFKQAGFAQGTIIGDWLGYPVAGNLRPYFKESRVISTLDWHFALELGGLIWPIIEPRTAPTAGSCLLVWTPQPYKVRQDFMLSSANQLLGAGLPLDTEAAYVSVEMPPATGRTVRLAYVLIPGGAGDCR